MVEQMPIFGGFAGGLEETTIVNVATHLNSFVTFGGTWHEDGPVHMRWGITTTREALAIAGHAIMAVKSVWPNIMSGNQYYTIAAAAPSCASSRPPRRRSPTPPAAASS